MSGNINIPKAGSQLRKGTIPGTMSNNPLLTKAGGVGLGLLAISHAKSSLDSARYGDMTTAALNAGVAFTAGYSAYSLYSGNNRALGRMITSHTTTPMLHALRTQKSNYLDNPAAQKNIGDIARNIAGAARKINKFFA